MDTNVVGWFEIPVGDMDRAVSFYQAVFGYTLERHKMGESDMAWFPPKENAIGAMGSLVYNKEFYKPSENGTLVYFTTPSGNLDEDIKKVEPAGGKIIIPKKKISDEYGYMVVVLDTEGNRIAIHSRT